MNSKFILYSLLFSIVFIACSSEEDTVQIPEEPQAPYFPPLTSTTWESTTIEALNWNAVAEQPLYDFLEEKETKAFIVLKDGKIVIEKYFNGATASDNHPWYSAGKTLTSFMVGLAQEEGFLNIEAASADYLGSSWSSLTSEQEQQITVKHHLSMTTGLDFSDPNKWNCTLSSCFTYFKEPNTYWFYHNAAYTITQSIVEGATGLNFSSYFNSKLRDNIGMQGAWLSLGYSSVYFSTARSMARFGLLNLSKGTWDGTVLMSDQNYFTEMTSTSQTLNPAYGYLWWLNGKNTYKIPASTAEYTGAIIPNAPDDLIAGLGKDDQKLYVVPSEGLVIVRMGDDAGETLLSLSSFDNELWGKLNNLIGETK